MNMFVIIPQYDMVKGGMYSFLWIPVETAILRAVVPYHMLSHPTTNLKEHSPTQFRKSTHL